METSAEEKLKQITTNIKRYRLKKNYKQEYLASRLNFSQNAYSKIESGRTNVSLLTLFKIAEILGITIYELIECEAVVE